MNQPGRFLFVGAIFITAIVVHALPVPAQEPQHFSAKADPQSNSSEAMHPGQPLIPIRAQAATGPLHANSANPRYFTDGSGKAIYLTGSHTWSNLMDRGTLHPPQVSFDYPAYMKWMVAHNFNFMRLWTAELPDSGEYMTT